MRLTIVDVFAERRYEGNQLAVVRDASALDETQMQTIAREMNFSETTFVTAESGHGAMVRIFTPAGELPFAGHPTLGTAFVLVQAGGGELERITLSLAAGDVPVSFAEGLAWMRPPAADVGGEIDRDAAARLVGLEPRELAQDMAPRLMHCGAPYCLVPVASLGALGRVDVRKRELDVFGPGTAAFSVCRGGHSADADFAARMHFFDGRGIREDAATGSANTAFAAVLKQLGERGGRIVEQGFELGRPSRIYIRLDDSIEIGGRVWTVADGRLL